MIRRTATTRSAWGWRGWHATQAEYLFLELAARALRPGGRAVFIAPDHFVERIPPDLNDYLEDVGLAYTGRSGEPLPGDFLQTGVRVHSFHWNKGEDNHERC